MKSIKVLVSCHGEFFYYFGDVAVVIITNSNITINIITNIINILRNNDNRELIKFAVVFVTQKMPD